MAKISTHDYVGPLSDLGQTECNEARAMFKKLESFVIECAESETNTAFQKRCFAIVRTKLEEACMFLIKGIAFEGKDVL